MTLDAQQRRARDLLRRQIREIEAPSRKALLKAARENRKARSKALGGAKGQRRERVRDPGYLAWLRRLPCVACMVEGGNCGATQAAHLRFSDAKLGRINPGMSRKPDDCWATPLGAGHHLNDQHQRSEPAFWTGLGIDAGQLSIDLFAAFQGGSDGLAVLRRHAGSGR